ncbi:hypothetical protein HK097_002782 [Rhizophlyctis rosea]|uniref:HMG box domain-containing protein n=1 Tax=Rhizophlyctis rosea TaxID=64517 RepID=A0AAD5SIA9_9FUNG|nr:hypothetical protein HK097_002782 [Rhizophlyctis rosea]
MSPRHRRLASPSLQGMNLQTHVSIPPSPLQEAGVLEARIANYGDTRLTSRIIGGMVASWQNGSTVYGTDYQQMNGKLLRLSHDTFIKRDVHETGDAWKEKANEPTESPQVATKALAQDAAKQEVAVEGAQAEKPDDAKPRKQKLRSPGVQFTFCPPPSAERETDVQQGLNREWERDQYEYGGGGSGRMPPAARDRDREHDTAKRRKSLSDIKGKGKEVEKPQVEKRQGSAPGLSTKEWQNAETPALPETTRIETAKRKRCDGSDVEDMQIGNVNDVPAELEPTIDLTTVITPKQAYQTFVDNGLSSVQRTLFDVNNSHNQISPARETNAGRTAMRRDDKIDGGMSARIAMGNEPASRISRLVVLDSLIRGRRVEKSVRDEFFKRASADAEVEKSNKHIPTPRQQQQRSQPNSTPPPPASAFMLYRRDHQRQIRLQTPCLTNNEVSTLIGEMWRKEKESIKDEYRQRAAEERVLHYAMYPEHPFVGNDGERVRVFGCMPKALATEALTVKGEVVGKRKRLQEEVGGDGLVAFGSSKRSRKWL